MTSEERAEYVKYRIESAYKTYGAAKVLADSGLPVVGVFTNNPQFNFHNIPYNEIRNESQLYYPVRKI